MSLTKLDQYLKYFHSQQALKAILSSPALLGEPSPGALPILIMSEVHRVLNAELPVNSSHGGNAN